MTDHDHNYRNTYFDSRPSLDPLNNPYESVAPGPADSTHDFPLLRPHTVTPSPGYERAPQDEPTEEEEEEEVNIRYGRIPQRVARRNKTIKRVQYVALSCFVHIICNFNFGVIQIIPWQLRY